MKKSKSKCASWIYLQVYYCFGWVKNLMESAQNIIGKDLGDILEDKHKPEEDECLEDTKTFKCDNYAFCEENDEVSGSNSIDEQFHPSSEYFLGKAKSDKSEENRNHEQLNMKEFQAYFPFIPSATFSKNNDSVGGKIITKEEILLVLLEEFKKKGYDNIYVDPFPIHQLLRLGEGEKELLEKLNNFGLQKLNEQQTTVLSRAFTEGFSNYKQYHFEENNNRIVNFCSDFGGINSHEDVGTLLQVCGLILKTCAIIIQQFTVDKTTHIEKKKYTLRLSVVTSEIFEEAMRRSQIQTIELTYTNVFPSDCRMFIGVPIYKDGYLSRKDQL